MPTDTAGARPHLPLQWPHHTHTHTHPYACGRAADQVGIPGLLHFAIHRPDIGLYYAPAFAEARQDEKEQKR